MLRKHDKAIQKYAKDRYFIIMRDSKEQTTEFLKFWKKRASYGPKPEIIKMKTIRLGEEGIKNAENIGLAAFHPPDFQGVRGVKTKELLDNMTPDQLSKSFKKKFKNSNLDAILGKMDYTK